MAHEVILQWILIVKLEMVGWFFRARSDHFQTAKLLANVSYPSQKAAFIDRYQDLLIAMLDDLVSGYAFQILLCYTEEFIDDTVTLMCLGILWVQNKPKLLPCLLPCLTAGMRCPWKPFAKLCLFWLPFQTPFTFLNSDFVLPNLFDLFCRIVSYNQGCT